MRPFDLGRRAKVLDNRLKNPFAFFGIIIHIVAQEYVQLHSETLGPCMYRNVRFGESENTCKAFIIKLVANLTYALHGFFIQYGPYRVRAC